MTRTIHNPLDEERALAARWEAQARAEIALMDQDDAVACVLGLAPSGFDRLLASQTWSLTTAYRVLLLVGVTPRAD